MLVVGKKKEVSVCLLSLRCSSSKDLLLEVLVFTFPSCLLKLGKASQNHAYHKYIMFTISMLCTFLTIPISDHFQKIWIALQAILKIPPAAIVVQRD